MGYEYGSATGQDDLLDKLRVFLLADGWTVDDYSVSGAGYRLHVHTGSYYANFRSCVNEIIWGAYAYLFTGLAMNISTGYDAGVVLPSAARAWSNQPGGPCLNATANQGIGVWIGPTLSTIPQYWFFSDGTNVDVIAEVSTGVFRSFHFGTLEAFGAYTGGQWFTGTGIASSGTAAAAPFTTTGRTFARVVHVDNPHSWYGSLIGVSDKAIIAGIPIGTTLSTTGFAARLIEAGVTVGGVAPLLPLYFATAAPNYWPLGYAKNTRVCRRDYLTAGEEVTIGADTYVAVPTEDTVYPTCQISIAVKKNV